MNRSNFIRLEKDQVRTGLAVWLDGKSFGDTSPIEPGFQRGDAPVCGPFLVERVLFGNFQGIQEPQVDLVNPATGDRRSMMSSWLLVPKESK